MTVEYNSLYGKIRADSYACSDTYRDVAARLGIPLDTQPIVCVKDNTPILRKDWDKPIGLKHGLIQFIIIPRSQTLKKIIQTVALIGLSVFAPYVTGTLLGLTGLTATFANAAIILGGAFLINMFLGPKPPKTETQENASPTYSLTGQGNRARLLNPIPRLYGTHIIYPDYASQPYQNFENNEQYLYQLFCLGVGSYQVDKININKTELWNSSTQFSESFKDVSLEIIPPGGTITLFPSNINTSSEVSGQDMRCEYWEIGATFSGNRATFTESISRVEYLSPGDRMTISGAGVNNGTYNITDLDPQMNWIEFGTTFTTVTSAITKTFTLENWLGPYVTNPNGQGTDKLQFDFTLPRGLYYANDEGGIDDASVPYEVQVQAINASGNPIGNWITVVNRTIQMATSTPQRFTDTVELTRGRYRARVRRTEKPDHDARYGTDIQWAGLKAFIPDDNVYPDVTLLAIKIRASNQLSSQSSQQINVIQRGKVPIFNGTSWSAPTYTANPAWVAADILRNTVYGAGLDDSRIDIEKLRSLANKYNTRGDTFNGVFDTSKTLWDALTSVLNVVRTQPILIAGRVTFVRDEPKSVARTVLTPQNILTNSFERQYIVKNEDSADDVIVEYMDSTTWEQNEVQCTLPDSLSEKPARIQLFGVTNRDQAWREGMYYAASNSYRRLLASVSTEAEGRVLLKGDPVIVNHDIPGWAVSGFVEDYMSSEKTLILDRDVTYSSTENNYVTLRRKDAKEFGPIRVTSNGFSNEAVLDATSLAAVEAAQGITLSSVLSIDDEARRTVFVFHNATNYVRRFLVVGASMRDLNKVDVSLVIDDDRVHTADNGTPPPPVDYLGPGVTPAGPVVRNVIVTQDPLSGSDPVKLNVSWAAASGATSYICQFSYDNVIWSTGYAGEDRTCPLDNVKAGQVYIRVAGIGEVIGPWGYPTPQPKTFGTPTQSPSPVTNLNVDGSIDQGVLEVSWKAGLKATKYRVQVYTETSLGSGVYDVLELTKNTSSTFASFTSSQITDAGGPWGRFRVAVYSINDFGTSNPVYFEVTNVTLGQVKNISLITPYKGGNDSADLQWSNTPNATQYRLKFYNPSNVLVREVVVKNSTYSYSGSRITADGGPWTSFQVRINAESSALIGPQASYTINVTP